MLMFFLKIKKNFQNLFKLLAQKIFKMIYGEINTDDSYSMQNLKVYDIDNKNINTFFGGNYKIYQVNFGRIYNDNVQNVAIINKNKIINGPSYQQIEGDLKDADHNICLKIGTPRIKKKFRGRVLNLAQGASGHNNFSHWLLDMLPKLKLYSEVFNHDDLDYLYLNKLNSFQKKSLELLGFQNLKIIDSNYYRHIECDELIATQHPSYFSGFILDQAKYVPNWIVKWLRDSFLEKSKKIDMKKNIFIDRSLSSFKHSQIINLEEVQNLLKEKNFDIVKLENLSFDEQIYVFSNAKIVIGAHGAGLTNLCFSKEKTKVIEIRSTEPGYGFQNKVYERISEINNLNYSLLSTPYLSKKNINGDLFVDLKVLNDQLKDI